GEITGYVLNHQLSSWDLSPFPSNKSGLKSIELARRATRNASRFDREKQLPCVTTSHAAIICGTGQGPVKYELRLRPAHSNRLWDWGYLSRYEIINSLLLLISRSQLP